MVHAAFVFDAIRTPRGKGKPDGSLHEVRPISLVSHLLGHLSRTARTCGAIGYVHKEDLGPETVRERWEHRDEQGWA